jgi:hypothetical protein
MRLIPGATSGPLFGVGFSGWVPRWFSRAAAMINLVHQALDLRQVAILGHGWGVDQRHKNDFLPLRQVL